MLQTLLEGVLFEATVNVRVRKSLGISRDSCNSTAVSMLTAFGRSMKGSFQLGYSGMTELCQPENLQKLASSIKTAKSIHKLVTN